MFWLIWEEIVALFALYKLIPCLDISWCRTKVWGFPFNQGLILALKIIPPLVPQQEISVYNRDCLFGLYCCSVSREVIDFSRVCSADHTVQSPGFCEAAVSWAMWAKTLRPCLSVVRCFEKTIRKHACCHGTACGGSLGDCHPEIGPALGMMSPRS